MLFSVAFWLEFINIDMQMMKNGIIEALLILLLMGILAIPMWRPLFHEGLFDSHDSMSNLIRSSALYHSLSDKPGYIRWFGCFCRGHGYPFLNFYAPLTYYAVSFFHLLGFTFTASIKLLIVLETLLRGFSMYLLTKQAFGKLESFLSGIAFMYAPYFICNIYVRGDFSEALSFSLIPLVMYFFWNLMNTGKARYFIYSAITYSMLILSHNCLALPFSAIIFLEILFFGLRKKNRHVFSKSILAFILGISLSAVFWLPALCEMKYVHLAKVTEGKFFYAENFRVLGDLFSSKWGFGRSIRDPMPAGIGWPHILAFLCSLILVWKVKPGKKSLVAFFIFITLAGAFLITPASKRFWDTLPLISFLQFPWRLLVLTSLGTSFLFVSFGVLHRKKKNILCILMLIAVIAFYSRYIGVYGYLNVPDSELAPVEIASNYNTTTYSDEYLPLWVTEKPDKKDDYVTICKGNGTISELDVRGNYYDFLVSAEEETELILSSFWYPGWSASVDGKEIPISINTGSGRICLSVPRGKHRILVKLIDTKLRMVSKLVSVISLIILFLMAAVWKTRGKREIS